MLQALHELAVVVHHFGLELHAFLSTPALLHLLHVRLQLIHLPLRSGMGLLTFAQRLAGFIAFARGHLDGHHQRIQ